MYLHHGVSVATPAIRKNLSPADAEMPGDDAWYGYRQFSLHRRMHFDALPLHGDMPYPDL